MKRASSRAKSSFSGPAGSVSRNSRQICRSSMPMKGVRMSTVAKRKRVLRKAMLTALMVMSRKEKWSRALAP